MTRPTPSTNAGKAARAAALAAALLAAAAIATAIATATDTATATATATDTASTTATDTATATDSDPSRFWYENALWHHRFDDEETAAALGIDLARLERMVEEWGRRPPPPRDPGLPLVLPYPGGRHPRIGFLDGARDPHRDTKASIFLPWPDAGHVVVDLPEALWVDGELGYLAHTHIPTLWDRRGVRLERQDWERLPGGALRARRVLPDGLEFRAAVTPRREAAGPGVIDLSLTVRNGAGERRGGLRAQVCLMLGGAPDFRLQVDSNKVVHGPVIATRGRDGRRWIATVWERPRPWSNPPCPCMHSDPSFPDLAPGEESTARGRIFFHEGEDIESEIRRREAAGELLPAD